MESSIYGRLTPPRACGLSLFTFSDMEDEGEKKNKNACEDDGERCQHRAVTTQTAKECGSLSVRLFLITQRSTDARQLNLPWAHTGLWVDFDFSSVTANQDLCVHLKATGVGVQWKISELFWLHV